MRTNVYCSHDESYLGNHVQAQQVGRNNQEEKRLLGKTVRKSSLHRLQLASGTDLSFRHTCLSGKQTNHDPRRYAAASQKSSLSLTKVKDCSRLTVTVYCFVNLNITTGA